MIIVPFALAHLDVLKLHPTQAHIGPTLADQEYMQALAAGDSWTALDGDKVLGCAGLVPADGVSYAWALLAHDIGRAGMVFATRSITRMLGMQSGRIETFVEASSVEAQRWIVMLGFTRDNPGVLREWFPDGADAILYSRGP